MQYCNKCFQITHLHNQCNLKHPREVSNTPCDAIPILFSHHHPAPSLGCISSIIQVRHIAFQSLYNLSKYFQLLSVFVSMAAVSLTTFTPTACRSLTAPWILIWTSPACLSFILTHISNILSNFYQLVYIWPVWLLCFSPSHFSQLLVFQHYSWACKKDCQGKDILVSPELRLRFGDTRSVLSDSNLCFRRLLMFAVIYILKHILWHWNVVMNNQLTFHQDPCQVHLYMILLHLMIVLILT